MSAFARVAHLTAARPIRAASPLPDGGQLIATKTLPPKRNRTLIERPRLTALVDSLEERLLTVVRAPAGFGKTTLGQAWSEVLRERGQLVAWLSLDAEDDEPQRFLRYVCHALRRAHPALGTARQAASCALAWAMLMDEIGRCGEQVCLFLDDFQSITQPSVHELLAVLLRHAPSNLHLVILSRDDAQLALSALRVRGRLLEIDAARLCFSAGETQAFFACANGAVLTSEDARDAVARIGGWAAALRLMSLSQEGRGAQDFSVPAALARATHAIDDYLAHLLASLPVDLQEFMLLAALPQRCCAGLAQAITGDGRAGDQLRQLDRRQLLMALDADGQWFALHPLIRAHLLRRLHQRDGPTLRALHWRAADWYHSRQLWSPAVLHALEAGANDQACDWADQCAMTLLSDGDVLTLLDWQRLLRQRGARPPARLRLAMAWAGILSLSFDQVAVLGRIESASDNPELRNVCQAARAIALALADDCHAGAVVAEVCLRQPPRDVAVRNALHNVMRLACLKSGRWADLYALPVEVESEALSRMYRLSLLGLADLLRGNLAQASDHLDLAMRQKAGSDSAQQMLVALPAGLLACVLYEQNRLAEAEALLAGRLDIIGKLGFLDCVLHAYLSAARLARRQGHIERAFALLEQAEGMGISRRWHRLTAAALLERLHLQLMLNRLIKAQACLQRLRQLDALSRRRTPSPMGDVGQFAVLGAAACALHRFQFAEAAAVLAPLLAQLLVVEHRCLAVRAGLMLTLARRGMGLHEQAARSFDAALALAAPAGMVAPMLDMGKEIGPLLIQACGRLKSPADAEGGTQVAPALLRDFTRRALNAWSSVHGTVALQPMAPPPRPRLSPRECGILELIAAGHSNKEIARTLGIGAETVKSHLKRIFTKLAVERRAQAVVLAEALGLLTQRHRPHASQLRRLLPLSAQAGRGRLIDAGGPRSSSGATPGSISGCG